MKIRTSELTGAALDWAVAKCEYGNDVAYIYAHTATRNAYSANWSQAGPIIEREKIATSFCSAPAAIGGNCWIATYPAWPEVVGRVWTEGPTPLIAAMRCFVANKLGDSPEVPDELA